jgi:glycosyltransferase involved in cell wall biosynthesis
LAPRAALGALHDARHRRRGDEAPGRGRGAEDGLNLLAVNWLDIGSPQAGGAEVHLFEILRRWRARGHTITWLASNWPGGAAEAEEDGIRVLRRGHRYDANHALPRAYKRELQGERFDAVIEDINKIPFFSPRWAKAPVLGVVPHLFGTTVFAEVDPLSAAYVVAHEAFIPGVYRDVPFMAISESTRDDLVARGLPADHVTVVHCGMDHERYRPSAPKADEPTVVFLGRLRKYKGVDVLLDAFALVARTLPAARLEIVGDGPHRPSLERRAERLGLAGRVAFRGYVSSDEKVRALSAAHVAVCPSPKEGWGLTVIEANACGTAVVASRSPGLVDSVKDGETGLLVPHGDVNALAGAIRRVIEDEALRARLERRGVEWAATFTWDRCADEAHAWLERSLGFESELHGSMKAV